MNKESITRIANSNKIRIDNLSNMKKSFKEDSAQFPKYTPQQGPESHYSEEQDDMEVGNRQKRSRESHTTSYNFAIGTGICRKNEWLIDSASAHHINTDRS
eukprot:TRINITY_DN1359_c0_g1_i1.p2 TRINITY_DN1359_c0_g1~~TRINITY_DN1359_c0_g1_i1.p2  ORF type:complete len:101 (+),score=22.04 TRINITY_DN1359_c0_g1_i1:573-875(+)